jgi:hypothetical protein
MYFSFAIEECTRTSLLYSATRRRINYTDVITKIEIFYYTPVRAERVKCMYLLKRKRKQAVVKHNYRGIPTHVCPCGSKLFKVNCIFHEGEIAMWFTDAECALCGAEVTVPTPEDYEHAEV